MFKYLDKVKELLLPYISKIKKYISMHWKRIIILIILLVIVFIIARNALSIPKGITTSNVSRKTLYSSFSANGRVKAEKQVDLKFNLPSKVVWVGVKNGDKVKAWQGVASLDSRILQKNLETSLSFYQTSRWDFEQLNDNYYIQGRLPDQVIFDKAARRIIDKSQFSLNRSVFDVEIKDIALKESVLVSPIAGTVVDTNNLVAGINLSGSDLETKFIRIVDLTSLYFEARLDEIDFNKVELNQEVIITIDAYTGTPCKGEVTFIGKEGEETSGGVVTIPVKISFKNCSLNLAANLNGEVGFVTSKAENVLTIPKKYLVERNGSEFVWVQTGKTVKQRKLTAIKTGLSTTTEVEITEGVKEGQSVIYIPGK